VSVYGTDTLSTGRQVFLGTPYSQFSHLAAKYRTLLAESAASITNGWLTYQDASLTALYALKAVPEY